MARKSSAALSVVEPVFGRPEPPKDLRPAEAEVWRTVVATKPAEWFSRDTHPLLTAYCRATIAAGVIAKEVDAFDEEWLKDSEGLKRYDRLMKMAHRQGCLLAGLATKMRLAQQSRYTPQSAATHAKPSAATKPWESRTATR